MLAVIGLLLAASAVMLFECFRVLPKIPGSAGWLRSAGLSGTAIILVMGFFVAGAAMLARSLLSYAETPLAIMDWALMAAIVVVTAVLLRMLYAKRRRALAAEAASAGVEDDSPRAPGSGSNGKRRRAA